VVRTSTFNICLATQRVLFYKVEVHLHEDYIKIRGENIEVGIMSSPQKGKANVEIIKKIADYFQVSRSHVRLVSGQKSRNKIVHVLAP